VLFELQMNFVDESKRPEADAPTDNGEASDS
jgi:hypothetical protein